MRRRFAPIAVAVTLCGLLAGFALADARNCDANAVMFCGAFTKTEFDQKLPNDGRSTDLVAIYSAHGITQADFDSPDTVDGQVNKDGTVMVSGKVVANGAQSVGRQFIPGSTADGSLWIRPTAVSFRSDSLEAFVNMRGGTFRWAVIKSCGNPVKATPVAPPPAPVPQVIQPIPTQPQPQPVTPVVVTPVSQPQPTPASQPAPATPTTGPGWQDWGGVGIAAIVGLAMMWHTRSRQLLRLALLKTRIR